MKKLQQGAELFRLTAGAPERQKQNCLETKLPGTKLPGTVQS